MMSSDSKKNISDDHYDLVFHAIANRTRRSLLTRLAHGPAMVTELAKRHDMSFPAVSKHIRVLEHARLVTRKVDGRVHRFTLSPEPLKAAEQWLSHYRTFWMGTLGALAHYAEKEKAGFTGKKTP